MHDVKPRRQDSAPPRPSQMTPDRAILSALNLSTAEIVPHGGSGFTSTYRVNTSAFLKTGTGRSAQSMFLGEFTSLQHLCHANPRITSNPISHGALADTPGGYYLLTSFLDFSQPSGSLAKELAALHTAPPHPDAEGKGFGFPVPTCCGSTEQDNTWTSTWPEFFAERRLRPILEACKGDAELRELGEATIERVVPRLLGALGEVRPALVHGDLWSGNTAGGRVYDPSCCYAHSEYEIGIMRMFGGFGREFWKEYHDIRKKDEPVDEYEDRVSLYMLYHQLNHVALFGGAYRSGAVGIMRDLLRKYGGK